MANPTPLKEEITRELGTLNARQLWAIVKLCKWVRLRARNNSAFNNLFNTLFPYARFRQVTKTRVNRITGQNESYPGLEIEVNGESVSIDESEE